MSTTQPREASVSPTSGLTLDRPRVRGVVGTGGLATLAAVSATAAVAALAGAGGVEFEVPSGGEAIPVSGVAFVTGVFSLVGVVLAVALARWSARPRRRFVQTTLTLTALSLGPPVVSGASTGTVVALVGLHLVAAVVVIPALAGSLAHRTG